MKRTILFFVFIFSLVFATEAGAQRVTDSGYKVVANIKADGTIQDSSYKIIGHITSDGMVQDASYKTIGHADGIPVRWAAFYFFFRNQ